MSDVTSDFSKFGRRERRMAAQLLTASVEQGFPDNFDDEGVQLMMNPNSGNVFFTNENFDVCMMNGDTLESFYSCPECGHEGFAEDMDHGEDNPDCQRYLVDIGVKSEPDPREKGDDDGVEYGDPRDHRDGLE